MSVTEAAEEQGPNLPAHFGKKIPSEAQKYLSSDIYMAL